MVRFFKNFSKINLKFILNLKFSFHFKEFMSLPELQQNPLVQRVIDIFDTDQNGEVDFKGN